MAWCGGICDAGEVGWWGGYHYAKKATHAVDHRSLGAVFGIALQPTAPVLDYSAVCAGLCFCCDHYDQYLPKNISDTVYCNITVCQSVLKHCKVTVLEVIMIAQAEQLL